FLLVLIVSLGLTQDTYDPLSYSTGTFHGCPARGKGGDPDLNLLKNRDLPPPSYQNYTVSQILSLPHDLPSAKRVHWSSADLDRVSQYERLGVKVQGYIRNEARRGKEDCNCNDPYLSDYHIWLVENPT